MKKAKKDLYIGIMSGTSLDAVDAVIANITDDQITILHHHQVKIDDTLQQKIAALCQPGFDEITRLAETDNLLADLYIQATREVLQKSSFNPDNILAIGLHGQTVRHLPKLQNTLQIGNPNKVALETNIITIFDVRRKDMAANGQGAPFAPAFHKFLFQSETANRLVINIGGIANISALPAKTNPQKSFGFDIGPGNTLLNDWILLKKGLRYDKDGQWGASGSLLPELLAQLIDHPYFLLPPPKSTGRETFNLNWLQSKTLTHYNDEDIQCTLMHFTVESILQAIQQVGFSTAEIILCGGGAKNAALMTLLQQRLPRGYSLKTSIELGYDSQLIEALMMAWIAKQHVNHHVLKLKNITGAALDLIPGAQYLPT